jgi:hypothetical protein
MSGDGVQLPIPAVRGHAGTVDGVADEVEQARSAVREVTMDTQAFGVLCQFLPGLLAPVFGLAVDTMNGSIEALRETASGLRAVADSAQATDESGARRITAAGRPAGGLPELPL